MTQPDAFRKTVVVNLENGLHMIPCSKIAQLVREADCDVRVFRDDQVADAKNVLDLLMLKAEVGTSLVLESEGDHGKNVLERLAQLFEDNFGLE